jgi:predicted 2-oxoglutarate/Fe(II)-dependent dioxygenase YbiX
MLHWDFSQFTFVICLTDDYEGGVLSFPRQNEHIRLKKGDIVFFPGGLTHPHFVNPTTSGVRDVLVGQILPQQQDHEIS